MIHFCRLGGSCKLFSVSALHHCLRTIWWRSRRRYRSNAPWSLSTIAFVTLQISRAEGQRFADLGLRRHDPSNSSVVAMKFACGICKRSRQLRRHQCRQIREDTHNHLNICNHGWKRLEAIHFQFRTFICICWRVRLVHGAARLDHGDETTPLRNSRKGRWRTPIATSLAGPVGGTDSASWFFLSRMRAQAICVLFVPKAQTDTGLRHLGTPRVGRSKTHEPLQGLPYRGLKRSFLGEKRYYKKI